MWIRRGYFSSGDNGSWKNGEIKCCLGGGRSWDWRAAFRSLEICEFERGCDVSSFCNDMERMVSVERMLQLKQNFTDEKGLTYL